MKVREILISTFISVVVGPQNGYRFNEEQLHDIANEFFRIRFRAEWLRKYPVACDGDIYSIIDDRVFMQRMRRRVVRAIMGVKHDRCNR